MSQENIETLREIYELVNTRFAALKGGDLDDLVAFFDPEVVIEAVDGPDPGTYHGHDGVRRWFNETYGPWAAIHVEVTHPARQATRECRHDAPPSGACTGHHRRRSQTVRR